MKNTKYLFILAFMLFNLITVAQISKQSTMYKLMAKTWIYTVPDGYPKQPYTHKVNYSSMQEINNISFPGGGGNANRFYYLSDTIETVFNDSKLGTVQNGKYMIVDIRPAEGARSVCVYEIITLTDSKFTIKSMQNNSITDFVAQEVKDCEYLQQ